MHTHFPPLCVIPFQFQVELELKSFIIHCSPFRSQLNRREEKEEVNGHENGLDNGEVDGDVTVERGQPFSASSSSSGRSSRPSSFRP